MRRTFKNRYSAVPELGVFAMTGSGLRQVPNPSSIFFLLGLSGEVRPAPHGPERLCEAQKHGFGRALIPCANAPRGGLAGLEVTAIDRIAEALGERMKRRYLVRKHRATRLKTWIIYWFPSSCLGTRSGSSSFPEFIPA